MEHYDVVIVGAGPAGSAAAIAARQAGARVLLLDRADFPRDKTCGDGIASHALEVLAGLGVTGLVDDRMPVPVLHLVAPSGAAVAGTLPSPAYTVPRRIFDARLVTAATAAGTELRRHTVRRVVDHGDHVTVDDRWSAGTLIGADGAASTVRRSLGYAPNPDGHVAFAIRGYADALPGPPELLILTTRSQWPAYAWSFPIGDGRANVGYGEVLRGRPLSRAYLLAKLDRLLPGTRAADLRAHHLPLSTHRPPPARGRILLVGDALSLINPFTGEGIFYAVLSGSLAGVAALAPDPATAYAAALRGRLGAHLRHSRVATRLTRWPRVVDAAVRAAHDPVVFSQLAHLGLGAGTLSSRTWAQITGEVLRPTPVTGP